MLVPQLSMAYNVDALVAKLGQWNEEMIKEWFFQDDVDVILQIQLPRHQHNDEII